MAKNNKISWEEFQKLKQSGNEISVNKVVTGSMEPIIMTGDDITIDLKNKNFKLHDIVVFWANGILICHTIIHINRLVDEKGVRTFVTAPYAEKGKDLPITDEEIYGLVTSHRLNFWNRLKLAWIHR